MNEEQKLFFLQCLENAGVDNWEGYHDAFLLYLEKFPDEEDM